MVAVVGAEKSLRRSQRRMPLAYAIWITAALRAERHLMTVSGPLAADKTRLGGTVSSARLPPWQWRSAQRDAFHEAAYKRP